MSPLQDINLHMGVIPTQLGALQPPVTPGEAVTQLVTILISHDVVQLQLETMSMWKSYKINLSHLDPGPVAILDSSPVNLNLVRCKGVMPICSPHRG